MSAGTCRILAILWIVLGIGVSFFGLWWANVVGTAMFVLFHILAELVLIRTALEHRR